MTILQDRNYYKPFNYPWAYELYLKQQHKMKWNPDDISFRNDVSQFPKMTAAEQEFIKKIFTFFVQSDNTIGAMYVRSYLPLFPQPEIRMMLLAFASMESNHADSYAKLMDTLNFADYKGFLEYPQMAEKHEYMEGVENLSQLAHKSGKSVEEYIPTLLRDIAVTSAFGEGLQLFGSFVMLLSFVERGLMINMGEVVSYSWKDENCHVKGLTSIFHTLKEEYPESWTDDTKRQIYSACRDMVELEDRFISLVYSDDLKLPNLPKADLHKYIRYLADSRLGELGLKPEYYITENPIEWLHLFTDDIQEDSFNNAVGSYTRSSTNFDEALDDDSMFDF